MSSPDLKTLETYFRLMNTNGAARVYHAALEAGVLTCLENGSKTSKEIAQACELSERPTSLLMEALCAMDVVETQEASYRLTEVARMLLYSDYRTLGNQYWDALPAYLQSGKSMQLTDEAKKSEEFYQTQAATLGWMLSHAAEVAASKLANDTQGGGLRILDVGAGAAIWSLAIARRETHSHVTAVDWAAVLEVAKETAETFGLQDRLTTIPGDLLELEFEENAFDLIIIANVTHLLTREENLALFRKVRRSIAKDGRIVLIDAFPGAAEGDIPFALYHLGLALRTENGKVYSENELRSMLETTGFGVEEMTPLDVAPFMVGMLCATPTK